MSNFETEEQQVEAIKRFWSENGTSIVVGAFLGLGGIWGWRWYSTDQLNTQEQSSEQYEQAVAKLVSDETSVASYVGENKSAAYGHLAAFQLAKVYVEKEQYDDALTQLKIVADNGEANTLKPVALLRMARINLAQDKFDESLALIAQVTPEAYKAEAAELKGDVLMKQGKAEQARLAYQAAADAGGLTNSAALQMKIDNVAVADGV